MPKNVPPLAERSGHCGGSCGRFRIKTNHGHKKCHRIFNMSIGTIYSLVTHADLLEECRAPRYTPRA